MRDFALDDGFLQSCINLPEDIRQKILSQLKAYTERPRDRHLGVVRAQESKHILSLPLDDTYSIVLHHEKPVVTLLFVAEKNSTSARDISKRRISPDHMVTAPLQALETLLVEGKYMRLAKQLLNIPPETRELQFAISEIEEILSAHLPPEARRFPNWWANQKSGKRAHAFAWMAAGWLVSKVDFSSGLVKFIRRNRQVERAS